MREDELVQLVRTISSEKCEKQHIEIKKAAQGCPSRLYDTFSSFANQIGGGVLLFGLEESTGYEVVGVYDAQDLQKKIVEQSLQMEPVVRPLCTVASVDGKIVVSAEISECDVYDKPCFYKGAGRLRGSFIRIGESDQPMTEYEIYSYEAYKRRIHDELRTVEKASLLHLRHENVQEYLFSLLKQKPNVANMGEKRILETQGIVQDGSPTLAGLLLFGEYPQEFFPQLSVIAMVVQGKEIGDLGSDQERFVDNKRFEGTLSQMLESSLAFVRRNMKVKTIVNDHGLREDLAEYPVKAVREILLNALIHRDYSVHSERSPIRLVMYEDRLELENPGGLYGRITIDDLGKVAADTRNPYIAGALEIMHESENRFSGIPTIRSELKRARMPQPVFLDRRGVFKVVFTKSSYEQESTHDMEQEILQYCKTPRTKEDLAVKFGFESPSYFFVRYVRPLIHEGKLHMTLPDKPKSKFQRYHAERGMNRG